MNEGPSPPSEETNPFEPPKADPPRGRLDLLSLHRFEFRSGLSRLGEGENTIAPLGMLGVVWAIAAVAFFFEVRKARALLVEIFEVAGPEDGA